MECFSLTQSQEHPPQPVLSIKVTGEVGRKLEDMREEEPVRSFKTRSWKVVWERCQNLWAQQYSKKQVILQRQNIWSIPLDRSYPDDENPFDEGQTEARDGAVSAGSRCCQTERQEEPDPVEEERHWEKNRINQ